MNKKDYNYLVTILKELGLIVFDEEGFFDFINYKEEEHPRVIYSISQNEDSTFSVFTLFGGEDYNTVEEVAFILKQDWNKENWITGVDEEGEYVELKEGLPIFEQKAI